MADSTLQGSPAATRSVTTDLDAPRFGVSGDELLRKWLRGIGGAIIGAAFGVALVVLEKTATIRISSGSIL